MQFDHSSGFLPVCSPVSLVAKLVQGLLQRTGQAPRMQVEPQCNGHITPGGDVRIEIQHNSPAAAAASSSVQQDPVQLAIFSHRCAATLRPWDHTLLTPCRGSNVHV